MKRLYIILYIFIATMWVNSYISARQTKKLEIDILPNWALGEFIRFNISEPVISPDSTTLFYSPMRKQIVKWEENYTFNPGAITEDDKIVVLYCAENNSGQGIGKRTSRIGYAESLDGVTNVY